MVAEQEMNEKVSLAILRKKDPREKIFVMTAKGSEIQTIGQLVATLSKKYPEPSWNPELAWKPYPETEPAKDSLVLIACQHIAKPKSRKGKVKTIYILSRYVEQDYCGKKRMRFVHAGEQTPILFAYTFYWRRHSHAEGLQPVLYWTAIPDLPKSGKYIIGDA